MQNVNNSSHLRYAMLNIHKLDKAVCAKHIATESSVSISHSDRSEIARRSAAQTRQRQHLAKIYPDDLKAQKDLQTEHVTLAKDVRCMICNLLSCLIYFPTSSYSKSV